MARKTTGKSRWRARSAGQLTVAEGSEAARNAGLNCQATVRDAVGNPDKVKMKDPLRIHHLAVKVPSIVPI